MKEVALISLFPAAGLYKELLGVVEQMLIETRNFDGCEQAVLMQTEDQEEIAVYMLWSTHEDYARYVDWRIESGALMVIQDKIEKDIEIKSFQVLNDQT